jgi:hypothetical protein
MKEEDIIDRNDVETYSAEEVMSIVEVGDRIKWTMHGEIHPDTQYGEVVCVPTWEDSIDDQTIIYDEQFRVLLYPDRRGGLDQYTTTRAEDVIQVTKTR